MWAVIWPDDLVVHVYPSKIEIKDFLKESAKKGYVEIKKVTVTED